MALVGCWNCCSSDKLARSTRYFGQQHTLHNLCRCLILAQPRLTMERAFSQVATWQIGGNIFLLRCAPVFGIRYRLCTFNSRDARACDRSQPTNFFEPQPFDLLSQAADTKRKIFTTDSQKFSSNNRPAGKINNCLCLCFHLTTRVIFKSLRQSAFH